MKKIKQIFWSILFLCPILSCSDEGGTIDTSTVTDSNFSVFTEIFQEFLEAHPPNTFTDGTSGLTFMNDNACQTPTQPSLYFDNQFYTLTAGTCSYYYNPEDDYESFSIMNSTLMSNGLILYTVVSFLDAGIPETGTYEIEYICDWFCYTNISVRVYYVNQDSELTQYFIGSPTSVSIVNNNGNVTASFDCDFFSGFYPYSDYYHGSGNVACCN